MHEAIPPVGGGGGDVILPRPAPASGVPRSPGAEFGKWLVGGLERVNVDLLDTQSDIQRLAAGEPVELHRLMLRLEESRMGLQLVLQVRNRLLEAYQDVMRMQV